MKCTVHNLKVMGSNPGSVELEVRSPAVLVELQPENIVMLQAIHLIFSKRILRNLIWISKLPIDLFCWSTSPVDAIY